MNTNLTVIPRKAAEIVGATGLSRAALAAMFRRDGLFGADSELDPAEQAVVQAALPRIRGLATRAAAVRTTPRLAALADYADALVGGRGGAGERARLEATGLAPGAVNEVARVIGDVFAVFEPEVAVQATAAPAAPYARAA